MSLLIRLHRSVRGSSGVVLAVFDLRNRLGTATRKMGPWVASEGQPIPRANRPVTWPISGQLWSMHLLWASIVSSVCDKRSCVSFPPFSRPMATVSFSLICLMLFLILFVCFPVHIQVWSTEINSSPKLVKTISHNLLSLSLMIVFGKC